MLLFLIGLEREVKEEKHKMTMTFYRVIVRGLNILAWATLGIIAIGIVIAYVTDHQITIIHNENPPAATATEKSGG